MEDHCNHKYSDYCAILNRTVDDVLFKEGESRFKQHLKPHTKGLLRYIGNVLDPTLDSVIHQLSNLVRFFELKFSSHLRLHYLLCGEYLHEKQMRRLCKQVLFSSLSLYGWAKWESKFICITMIPFQNSCIENAARYPLKLSKYINDDIIITFRASQR